MKAAAELLNTLNARLKQTAEISGFARELLWTLAKETDAVQGAFFLAEKKDGINILRYTSGYAYHIPESEEIEFEFGEGLAGQVAREGKLVFFNNVPEGYITVLSGLGHAGPSAMIIAPVKTDGQTKAVLELAYFRKINEKEPADLEKVLQELEPGIRKYFTNTGG